MARSAAQDPLDKFRWNVQIDGFSKLGFSSVSVPSYSITTQSYPEGGAHLTPRKIIDSIEYSPIVLSRGVTNDTSFNKWATGFFDLVTNNAAFKDSQGSNTTSDILLGLAQNNGAKPVASNKGLPFSYRRDVKIEHLNRAGQVEVVYFIYGAFPIQYKPASDFEASADDEVSIETLTLAYESFEVKYTGISGFVGNFTVKNILKI